MFLEQDPGLAVDVAYTRGPMLPGKPHCAWARSLPNPPQPAAPADLRNNAALCSCAQAPGSPDWAYCEAWGEEEWGGRWRHLHVWVTHVTWPGRLQGLPGVHARAPSGWVWEGQLVAGCPALNLRHQESKWPCDGRRYQGEGSGPVLPDLTSAVEAWA